MVPLPLEQGRFQTKLETKCATEASGGNWEGLGCESSEKLWMQSWIKELKCMWWGIYLSAHETDIILQVNNYKWKMYAVVAQLC